MLKKIAPYLVILGVCVGYDLVKTYLLPASIKSKIAG